MSSSRLVVLKLRTRFPSHRTRRQSFHTLPLILHYDPMLLKSTGSPPQSPSMPLMSPTTNNIFRSSSPSLGSVTEHRDHEYQVFIIARHTSCFDVPQRHLLLVPWYRISTDPPISLSETSTNAPVVTPKVVNLLRQPISSDPLIRHIDRMFHSLLCRSNHYCRCRNYASIDGRVP